MHCLSPDSAHDRVPLQVGVHLVRGAKVGPVIDDGSVLIGQGNLFFLRKIAQETVQSRDVFFRVAWIGSDGAEDRKNAPGLGLVDHVAQVVSHRLGTAPVELVGAFHEQEVAWFAGSEDGIDAGKATFGCVASPSPVLNQGVAAAALQERLQRFPVASATGGRQAAVAFRSRPVGIAGSDAVTKGADDELLATGKTGGA